MMGATNRIIVKAVRVRDTDAGRVVGLSLRSLRLAAGLTQSQIAERLGVGQAAVSKIEQRGDVQISSLHRYVEALGGRLRIDAAFPSGAELPSPFRNSSSINADENSQYILPLFNDEPKASKDIVISIRPEYAEKILAGVKTVELRRRFPISGTQGTLAYIYSTAPVQAVVGAAEIADVERLPIDALWHHYGESASIKRSEFESYFSGLEQGYALSIARVWQFTHKLPLSELKERFGFKAPQSYLYAKPNLQRALQNERANVSN